MSVRETQNLNSFIIDSPRNCPMVGISWSFFTIFFDCPCPSLPGFLTPGCLCPAKVKNYTLNKGNKDVRKSTNFRLLILQWAQDLPCRVSLCKHSCFWQQQDKRIRIPMSSAIKQGISFFPSIFPTLKGVNFPRTYRPCCLQWNRAARWVRMAWSNLHEFSLHFYPGRWGKVSFHVTVMRLEGMQGVN